jgi:hypothetical protein
VPLKQKPGSYIPVGTEESMSLELVKFAIAALKIRALPTGRAVVFALQIASEVGVTRGRGQVPNLKYF